MLTESIQHGLSNLARFTGRDTRRQFWPYAASAFAATTLLYMVPFALLMGQSLARLQRLAQAPLEEAAHAAEPAGPPLAAQAAPMPDMEIMIPLVSATALLFILLVASAVMRRLHDSGLPGWPALLPVILLGSGMWLMNGLFASVVAGGEPDMARFAFAVLNNLVYLASLGLLAALLLRRGSPGENRYGPPPA